jgi:hypothetical protein
VCAEITQILEHLSASLGHADGLQFPGAHQTIQISIVVRVSCQKVQQLHCLLQVHMPLRVADGLAGFSLDQQVILDLSIGVTVFVRAHNLKTSKSLKSIYFYLSQGRRVRDSDGWEFGPITTKVNERAICQCYEIASGHANESYLLVIPPTKSFHHANKSINATPPPYVVSAFHVPCQLGIPLTPRRPWNSTFGCPSGNILHAATSCDFWGVLSEPPTHMEIAVAPFCGRKRQ